MTVISTPPAHVRGCNCSGMVFGISVLGIELQQNHNAIPAIDLLFDAVEPMRLIEIGTAAGGLTVFLGIYGAAKGIDVITYDITDYRQYRDIHNELGIQFRNCDVFNDMDALEKEIKKEGVTVVFCDGGDKPREFKMIAPMLKKGDVVLAHDYCNDPETWPVSEINDSVFDTPLGVEKFMQDFLGQAAWLCCRKV